MLRVIQWGSTEDLDQKGSAIYKAINKKPKLDQIIETINPKFFDKKTKITEEHLRNFISKKVKDDLDSDKYFK